MCSIDFLSGQRFPIRYQSLEILVPLKYNEDEKWILMMDNWLRVDCYLRAVSGDTGASRLCSKRMTSGNCRQTEREDCTLLAPTHLCDPDSPASNIASWILLLLNSVTQ